MVTPPVKYEMELDGVGVVLQELSTFPLKVQTRHLKPATNAATRIVLAEARRQSPRGNGFFRRSLIVVTRQRAGVVKAQVGQAKQPKTFTRQRIKGSQINRKGFAAPIHFIESGTEPHTIAAPNAPRLTAEPTRAPGNRLASLAIGTGKRRVYRATVQHPGTRPNPVLSRAAKVASQPAGIAFRDKLADRLKLKAQ